MALSIHKLLDIQGTEDSVTPTEAIERLRGRGRKISRRTVSFWQEQGLIPAAMRVGSRGGVYPAIMVDLIDWISACRDRGVGLETVRELQPLWAYLMQGESKQEIDVADFERVARQLGLTLAASYCVPQLIHDLMSGLCHHCLGHITWRLKDGTVRRHAPGSGLRLGFVIGEVEPESGDARILAWTQLTLPGLGDTPDLDDPALVILGLPIGVSLTKRCAHSALPQRRHRAPRSTPCRVERQYEDAAMF